MRGWHCDIATLANGPWRELLTQVPVWRQNDTITSICEKKKEKEENLTTQHIEVIWQKELPFKLQLCSPRTSPNEDPS